MLYNSRWQHCKEPINQARGCYIYALVPDPTILGCVCYLEAFGNLVAQFDRGHIVLCRCLLDLRIHNEPIHPFLIPESARPPSNGYPFFLLLLLLLIHMLVFSLFYLKTVLIRACAEESISTFQGIVSC